ncbi:MAG: hypothetical protein WAX12_04880 [Candidatus Microthrix subdominans]
MSDTNTRELAQEALTHEGPDAYSGATIDQLAEFLDAHPNLWVAATDDSSWHTLTGFTEALTAFVDGYWFTPQEISDTAERFTYGEAVIWQTALVRNVLDLAEVRGMDPTAPGVFRELRAGLFAEYAQDRSEVGERMFLNMRAALVHLGLVQVSAK